jgi:hypothetical protein
MQPEGLADVFKGVKRLAVFRNLRHEAIYHPAESGLEGARSGGKIGGKGHACDIGVARGIDTYASAIVDVISTQVARVKKGRAGGVQLADKGIAESPAESGLEGVRIGFLFGRRWGNKCSRY